MRELPIIVVSILLTCPTAYGGDLPEVPSEVRPFVSDGTRALYCKQADLNLDKRTDYLLVIEDSPPEDGYDSGWEGDRDLLLLVRDDKGILREVKRNGTVVFCRRCGGMMGDPFSGISTAKGAFQVDNDGGTSFRWSESYKFRYSKRDHTWYLDRFERHDFHVSDPEHAKRMIYDRKDLGQIDFADFDSATLPEH